MAEARATAAARRSPRYPDLATALATDLKVLRVDLPPLKVVEMDWFGFWTAEPFLVTKVTPPFSPEAGWMPTACVSNVSISLFVLFRECRSRSFRI